MSTQTVIIENQRVTIAEDGKPMHDIEVWDLNDVGHQLAYAQILLLQALVERQSMMAAALTKLAEALSARMKPPDPKAALDAATGQVKELMTSLGISLPNLQKK